MTRTLAFLALVCTLSACDSAEDRPAVQDLLFDYVRGDVPMPGTREGVVLAATPGAVTMQIRQTPERDRSDDRLVSWVARGDAPEGGAAEPYQYWFDLPLNGLFANIDGAQISVFSGRVCNPYGGERRDDVRETRVPASARAGSQVVLTGCRGEPLRVYLVRGTETVTVPAGTFEALVLVGETRVSGGPKGIDDRTVEFWAGEDGLVRLDLLTAGGVLRGSLVRASR